MSCWTLSGWPSYVRKCYFQPCRCFVWCLQDDRFAPSFGAQLSSREVWLVKDGPLRLDCEPHPLKLELYWGHSFLSRIPLTCEIFLYKYFVKSLLHWSNSFIASVLCNVKYPTRRVSKQELELRNSSIHLQLPHHFVTGISSCKC